MFGRVCPQDSPQNWRSHSLSRTRAYPRSFNNVPPRRSRPSNHRACDLPADPLRPGMWRAFPAQAALVLVCFGVAFACGAAGQGSDSQQATDALNTGLDAARHV